MVSQPKDAQELTPATVAPFGARPACRLPDSIVDRVVGVAVPLHPLDHLEHVVELG